MSPVSRPARIDDANSASQGILPIQCLRMLAGKNLLAVQGFESDQFQPASVDLRLGAQAYRIKASFLPGASRTVADRLSSLCEDIVDLRGSSILERGAIYLVPLLERLELPANLGGMANPKSSTGRLDVFTRLITDYSTEFDRIPNNYRGPLYAEVAPRSFNIRVCEGERLLQLRLQKGRALTNEAELIEFNEQFHFIPEEPKPDITTGGIAVRIDASGDGHDRIVGFRARRGVDEPIDLSRVGGYFAEDFWDPVRVDPMGGIVLQPDAFYILASKSSVWIPPDFAGEMVAYDTLVGEFRVHYAGFFDPGFGLHSGSHRGTRAVLEVRSHEIPFLVDDGQVMGRILLHRLTEPPEHLYGAGLRSNYATQGLTLAKHFRPWQS